MLYISTCITTVLHVVLLESDVRRSGDYASIWCLRFALCWWFVLAFAQTHAACDSVFILYISAFPDFGMVGMVRFVTVVKVLTVPGTVTKTFRRLTRQGDYMLLPVNKTDHMQLGINALHNIITL